jgi:hypothetical protein
MAMLAIANQATHVSWAMQRGRVQWRGAGRDGLMNHVGRSTSTALFAPDGTWRPPSAE